MSAWSDAVAAAPAPYLWWKLDETSGTTAADATGNGRSGTYASATLNQTGLIPGDSGSKSISIAGTAGNVSKTSGLAYPDVGVTYALTFKSTASVGGRFWPSDGNNSYLNLTTNTQGVIKLTTQVNLGYNATALFDGNPHLVIYVVRSTTMELWVDGTQVGSGSHSATSANRSAVTAKQSNGAPTGSYEDVILWSSALTSTQIGDLYTGWSGSLPALTATLAATTQARTAAFTAEIVGTGTLAGTLQAKTAAFTVATVAAVALTGTMQPKAAAFTIATPAADVTMASTLPAKTASFTMMSEAAAALSGTLPAKTASFSLSASAQVSLAATVQAKTASIIVSSADRTVLLSGSLRRKTSTVTIFGEPVVRLAATMRAKTAAFDVTTVPTFILAATLQPKIATFTTYAVTPVTPSPMLGPQAVVKAQAFGAVTMVGTQPVYAISEAYTAKARQRIVVDGIDVTYFRGIETPDASYTLLEPLLYGPGNLDVPQVAVPFETLGAGDLSWLRPNAVVEVQRVIDDVVVGTDYKGVIVAFDQSGRTLSVELGGVASGRASLRDRQDVIFPRVNDIGHQIADSVRDLGLPHYPPLGPVTGIEVMTTGGVGHLEHIQNLVAQAWTRAGKHWTVMPDEATGVYETHQKDETTVHATAFLDDARTVANLRRDLAEEPNRIFITGVTPQGQRVRFGVYPGLRQGPVPPFPGHMESGDTGEGVRLLIGRLHSVGYLRLVEVVGGYDFDVVEAVKALQDDAGLPKTGEVNEATWDALYDLNVTGTSLEWAHIEPAAQRSVVRRWNRSGSGTILEFNDGYDHEVLPVDRTIDAGVGKTRSQLREFARTVLHDSDSPNWVGDITFHTGALLYGDVAVGATIDAGDVMPALELRPGMNVRLPQFDGGTLVHVVACQVNEDGIVTATVDTRFRDAAEVWDIIDRNKESRNDPARRRNQKHRSSTIRKDSIGEWDEIGGLLGHDVQLDAGWNVFEVVAAMEGQIAWLRIVLETPAEFACAVFGRAVDRGWLDDHVPLPLVEGHAKAWQTHHDALDDRWLLYSAGTAAMPCGFSPGNKPDGDPITGRHLAPAGFRYASEDRTKLYVAVWVEEENVIPLGRIMRNQLESGA